MANKIFTSILLSWFERIQIVKLFVKNFNFSQFSYCVMGPLYLIVFVGRSVLLGQRCIWGKVFKVKFFMKTQFCNLFQISIKVVVRKHLDGCQTNSFQHKQNTFYPKLGQHGTQQIFVTMVEISIKLEIKLVVSNKV